MTFRFKCQGFGYSANASLYGCTIVKFKAFTDKAEQRSNNADKGFAAILIILRFQKILKDAKSCLKIAEVTTSISKGVFLCRVTGCGRTCANDLILRCGYGIIKETRN